MFVHCLWELEMLFLYEILAFSCFSIFDDLFQVLLCMTMNSRLGGVNLLLFRHRLCLLLLQDTWQSEIRRLLLLFLFCAVLNSDSIWTSSHDILQVLMEKWRFWYCAQELVLTLHFIQGGTATVILSGPGGPAVASIKPQTSELVGEIVHDSLLIHLLFILGCIFLYVAALLYLLVLSSDHVLFLSSFVYVSALVQWSCYLGDLALS